MGLTAEDWEEALVEDDYLLDVLMEENIEDFIDEEVIAEASNSDDEIIEYLLDSNIDLESISEEL